jgi:hypothetical protein
LEKWAEQVLFGSEEGGEQRGGKGHGGRNDLNNICTHEYMDNEKINCKFENIDLFLLILQNAFLQLGIHSYSPVPILVDDTLSFRYLM